MLAKNNYNQKQGLSRLNGCRVPTHPNPLYKDKWLRRQQKIFLRDNPEILEYLGKVVRPAMACTGSMVREAEEHYDDPHPKRMLRVQAMEEMKCKGTSGEPLWLKSVLYKCKTDEIAKLRKVIRMIGDLGVLASLQGFVYTAVMKDAMCTRHEVEGGIIWIFKKAASAQIQQLFREATNPPGRFIAGIFSDDMLLSIRHGKTVKRYNLDISKCDKSHTGAMFECMIALCGNQGHEMKRIVDQCALPVRIHDQNEKSRYVILKPKGHVLYSGSTLTTAINNVSSFHIIVQCVRRYDGTVASLHAASEEVGYIISVEECHKLQDMQFLKYSPVIDTKGEIRALLNIGVLYRASGVCRGDLPGRGKIETRARDFQAGLLKCTYPQVTFPHLITLRKTARGKAERFENIIAKGYEYKIDETGAEGFSVTDEEVFRRYDLTPGQFLQCLEFGTLDFGEVTSEEGPLIVLKKDYGLEPQVQGK